MILSAGVVVVHIDAAQPRYLLLRAYHYWDFPKGIVEAGEAPLAAAIREVEEETTLTGLDFRWGEEFRETVPYRNSKIARYYLAASPTRDVDLPVSAELGRPEHDEFRWLDYAAAHALLSVRVQPVLEWAQQRIGAQP